MNIFLQEIAKRYRYKGFGIAEMQVAKISFLVGLCEISLWIMERNSSRTFWHSIYSTTGIGWLSGSLIPPTCKAFCLASATVLYTLLINLYVKQYLLYQSEAASIAVILATENVVFSTNARVWLFCLFLVYFLQRFSISIRDIWFP